MSRNIYDPTTDTLTPISGWQSVDTELSSSSERPVRNNVLKSEFDKTYKSTDSSFTDLADGDYIPVQDVSASTKKKTTWSNIVAKMKAAFGIASSGDTYLKKDGTWGTPTNTTYSSKAAVSGGTDVSLVTTGEKYTWNTKTSKIIDSNYRTPYFTGNLNDITETCVVNATNTCTNLPTTEWNFIMTFMHCYATTYGAQLAVNMNSGKTRAAIRTKSGGNWGSWKQLMCYEDIKSVQYYNNSSGSIDIAILRDAVISANASNMNGVICYVGPGSDINHTCIKSISPGGSAVTNTSLVITVWYKQSY